MNKLLLFVACLFFVAYSLEAQTITDSIHHKQKKVNFNGAYFKSYLLDAKDVAISPLKPTKQRLIGYGVAVAGFSILYTQDENIKKFAQENKTKKSTWYSEHIFEPIGSGNYSIPLLGLFYLTGVTANQDRLTKTALLGIKAYLVSGAFARIPKYTFRRERPNSGADKDSWFKALGNTSFISGHTTSAFSIATIIAKEYKHTVWVPIASYSLATLSGLSRIHDNKHWASDVFCGAMFGYGISSLIHNSNNWGVTIMPTLSAEDGGVSVVIPF